ncbi:unnamed protein product [Cyclocybe aegerita]|uniref:BTB domain-containing protein n=1 Tax=Cyclocybe aegerita TaxID=1973307 RepID=A0A8S0VSW3_CYCAE|nr:unnamed protein product [Cyclocybe aegerita]
MSEPASKRRRTESEEGGSDSETQKPFLFMNSVQRSKYWFDDGNVVLRAEGTLFRVHCSMMAHQSKVFKDMFGMPQPQEQTQDVMVEDCPVITLGDTGEDVEHILAVFYDNINALDLRQKMHFSQLSAFLRLGKKYEIEYLQNEALKLLRLDFPATLDAYDKTFAGDQVKYDFPRECGPFTPVILLALDHSIPSVLLSAYLTYVSSVTPRELFTGKEGDILTSSITAICALDRDRLLRCAFNIIQTWWAGLGACSNNSNSCTNNRRSATKELALMLYPSDTGMAPRLTPWNVYEGGERTGPMKTRLCATCMTGFKDRYEDARKELWKKLPGFFGLEEWEKLKDFDA